MSEVNSKVLGLPGQNIPQFGDRAHRHNLWQCVDSRLFGAGFSGRLYPGFHRRPVHIARRYRALAKLNNCSGQTHAENQTHSFLNPFSGSFPRPGILNGYEGPAPLNVGFLFSSNSFTASSILASMSWIFSTSRNFFSSADLKRLLRNVDPQRTPRSCQ